MPNNLLIVESPGKIKKLSKILGPNWLVKASVGHIRQLAKDGDHSLGFDIDGQSIDIFKERYLQLESLLLQHREENK